MGDFTPTDEQVNAVDLAVTGTDLAIEALAGAGKTSTLKMIAAALDSRCNYLAFNRSIADEAKATMPGNVASSTVHSLAYRALGFRYRARMDNQQRRRLSDVARALEAPTVLVDDYDGGTIEFDPVSVVSHARRGIDAFCMSADAEPTQRHVPYVPKLDKVGSYVNNDAFALQVLPTMRKVWADLQSTDERGLMTYSPQHYLKQWQLTDPHIDTDVILYDEAQDANPVMLAIIAAQDHAQRIFVGDTHQQIYEWNGAVNAMGKLDGERCHLTRSFRFGHDIAAAANVILERLDADVDVVGAGPEGLIVPVDRPDVLLCRTNAETIGQAFTAFEQGLQVAIVGGVAALIKLAEAADDLMTKGRTWHPELAIFSSWGEVLSFCADRNTDSASLDPIVRLIDSYGADALISMLRRCCDERRADIVLSTAHKSKGREWGSVKMGADFVDPDDDDDLRDLSDSELRLMYVAVTRAQHKLDPYSMGWLVDSLGQ